MLLFQALGLSPVIEKNKQMYEAGSYYVFKKSERQASITYHITLMVKFLPINDNIDSEAAQRLRPLENILENLIAMTLEFSILYTTLEFSMLA